MRIIESGSPIALPNQFRRPRSIRETALHSVGDVQAAQQQIETAFQRLAEPLLDAIFRFLTARLALPAGLPQTGEIGLAVSGTGGWSRSVELPVFGRRNILGAKSNPLCLRTSRQKQHDKRGAHSRQYTATLFLAANRPSNPTEVAGILPIGAGSNIQPDAIREIYEVHCERAGRARPSHIRATRQPQPA